MNAPIIQYSRHPPGLAHQRDTVAKMARLAREDAHTYEIRHLATSITHHLPGKQPRRELAALYDWTWNNIRYRYDPVAIEWLQRPTRTLIERAGDCDDIGCLLGSLCETLGYPVRFRIVGPYPGVYKHVYVEAQLPEGEWVTLDPVIEPPADRVGQPYTLGPGWRARGATLTFDQGGRMLGAPTTARERLLWESVPYFPQVPPTGGYADPSDAGRPMPANYRYRSAVVPGKTVWEPTHSGVMRPSDLGHYRSVAQPRPGQLALGDNGELLRYDDGLGWNVLRAIEKGFEALAPAAPLIAMIPGVGPIAAGAITAGAAVSQIVGNTNQARPGVPKVEVTTPGGAGVSVPGPAAVSIPGGAGRAPVTVTTTVGQVMTPVSSIRATSPSIQLKAQIAQATHPAWSQAGDDWKRPHAELRSKYPPDARQLWDPTSRLFRVFIPVNCAGDVGAFRPSFTFTLGHAVPPHRHRVMLPSGEVIYTESEVFAGWLAPNTPVLGQAPADFAAFKAKGAKLAQAAVDTVRAFINSHGKPPTVALADVRALQTHDSTWSLREKNGKSLKVDGLYGPNTQKASAWYLGAAVSAMPPWSSAFSTSVLSWTAPTVAAVVPTTSTATAQQPSGGLQLRRIFIPPTTTTTAPAPTRTATVMPGVYTPSAPTGTTAPRILDTLWRFEPAITSAATALCPVRVATVVPGPAPAAVQVPAYTAPTQAPRYVPFTVAPPEQPSAVRLPVTGPSVPVSVPVTSGPVPPIPMYTPGVTVPAACAWGTQAAPPGGCPPAAVYRDASGTPRVTGYVEVGQENQNPGMPPVGMDNPQRADTHPWLPLPSGPTYPQMVQAPSGDKKWLWVALAWLYARRKKHA